MPDIPFPPGDSEVNSSARDKLERYADTATVTQTLERDIIEFLTAKHTANATFDVEEVMDLYNCSLDRARRVIANLVRDQVLIKVDAHTYKVDI